MHPATYALVLVHVLILGGTSLAADAAGQRVGVARIDITPDYNIRLNGFAHRKAESDGVDARIHAKGLAFEDANGKAVLLAVDSLGVPDYMTRDVAARLQKKAGLDPTRFAVTSTHTHSAPIIANTCPNIAGEPIPPPHQEKIDRYTRELADKLEEVSLAALADLAPATIEYGIGTHGLAKNRRTPGGPVDHDLPVMAIKAPDGKLRAVYLSYACHCVTLSHMKINGDWAGFAAEALEKIHPGAIALTSVGCGADSNPLSDVTGDKVHIAIEQGEQLAAAVDQVLERGLTVVDQPIAAQVKRISLAFGEHPTREYWEKVAQQQDYQGYHARVQLAKLDRGEKLQTELSYPIQTWVFGDQLAMVFLPGEVVVDYALRLKREFDRSRLWINAYSNDVPCYIPSERVLAEGGYEVDSSMWFYDRPTRLATGIEKKIIDEVHRQIPDQFLAPKGTEGLSPRSPQQAIRTIHTKPDLDIELVVSEPLVMSPVAIDWDNRGRMIVCEMFDYPTGVDGSWQPGGRVKILEDTDDDGEFDRATMFLENIPFPTGVTAWGNGVFICAAPDILYAEDTDGDGKADKVEKRFSGFATDNYQARVNSLSLGLDNWIYGANGLLGGVITSAAGKVDIRSSDFRFRPGGGPLETVTGLTQFGRVRDDFGQWYGCDNSRALLHFPHEQRYIRRNPHAAAPPPVVVPEADYDVSRVYPMSRTLERYNEPNNANRFTSAGGLGIYRDTLLGEAYAGNAFTTESVHNLVHRMILTESDDGSRITRRRAADERESEFLASTDHWFRPVQMRTGPDGALYVVDMYRFLIEHPRWIPAERLAQLDVRAGADRGRIYRLRPTQGPLRQVRDLTKLSGAELAAALDTPNGTERDRVHIELLVRCDMAAAPVLQKLAEAAGLPQVRMQALCALDGIGALAAPQVENALKDADARVRHNAVRLSEKFDGASQALLAMVADQSPLVRRQLAFTLGEIDDPRAGEALAALARGSLDDAEMRVAVLSSAARHCGELLAMIVATDADAPGRSQWLPPLVATAAASDDPALLAGAIAAVLPADASKPSPEHFSALAGLLEVLDRRQIELADPDPRLQQTIDAARRIAGDDAAPEPARAAALSLVGRGVASESEIAMLCRLLARGSSEPLRAAAIASLQRQHDPRIASLLLADWQQTSPTGRTEIVNLLMSRDEWTIALLAALKDRRIQPNEISLTDRQRLAESSSAEVRHLTAELFPPEQVGRRADVLSTYRSVASLTGDPAAGVELFKKNCAACHVLGETGHAVGPDLAALRDRDVDYLVKNVLDPNAVIEPRFVNYQVRTHDGRWLSGVMKSETANALTLVAGNGATETIARPDVKEIRASSLSMMPEGFETALSPQQMADLIAHLKAAGPPRQFAGNAPQRIDQAKDGSLMLPADKAEISGGAIMFEPEFRNIGYWKGESDSAAWTVRIYRGGEFGVYFDYACAQDAAGNRYVLAAGKSTISGVVASTGPDWSRYVRSKVGSLRLDPGEHRVTMRPEGALRGALIDLRTIALVPAGKAPAWPAQAVVAAPSPDELARDAPAVARVILDKNRSQAAREAAVKANPQFAGELIVEMTRDLAPGTPMEYERIPWLWRVAIACGRRNDAGQMRRVLDASLPRGEEPLRDWQAVVVGGGIINGISLQNIWPAERIAELLRDDESLQQRWQRSLDLASPMADDEKVPKGTRYDALRMLGMEPWEKRGGQLVKYLPRDVDAELQMGAVSGLADVNSPHATAALIDAIGGLTEGNRNLALDALLRDNARTAALLDAVGEGKVTAAMLGEARVQRLLENPDPALRTRAEQRLKGS
jgi:putative membrane-bound dehydrogenase-like protein